MNNTEPKTRKRRPIIEQDFIVERVARYKTAIADILKTYAKEPNININSPRILAEIEKIEKRSFVEIVLSILKKEHGINEEGTNRVNDPTETQQIKLKHDFQFDILATPRKLMREARHTAKYIIDGFACNYLAHINILSEKQKIELIRRYYKKGDNSLQQAVDRCLTSELKEEEEVKKGKKAITIILDERDAQAVEIAAQWANPKTGIAGFLRDNVYGIIGDALQPNREQEFKQAIKCGKDIIPFLKEAIATIDSEQ